VIDPSVDCPSLIRPIKQDQQVRKNLSTTVQLSLAPRLRFCCLARERQRQATLE
jgi:hypothetical protein